MTYMLASYNQYKPFSIFSKNVFVFRCKICVVYWNYAGS